MNGRLTRIAALATACLGALAAAGADPAPGTAAHLGVAASPVALPGAGQVIGVFLAITALALGIAYAIRRLSPNFAAHTPGGSGRAVSVLARQALEPGVRLHVVGIGAARLAIVTGRAAIAIQVLPDATDPAPAPPTERAS